MAQPSADYDILFVNGKIRVSALRADDVEALAVKDGKVAALGASADLLNSGNKSDRTRVVDLQGRRCVPSLVDGHCHPVRGVAASMFAVKFGLSDSPQMVADAIAQFVDRNPDAQLLMGGRFGSEFMDKYADVLKPTPREWLDAHSRGKAVYLREQSGHGAWANTAALEFLGITKDTPDPKGGQYVRDKSGALNGVLLGEADMINRRKWPDYTPQQYDQAVREVVRLANSLGITGIKDADVSEEIARAFRDADISGDLSLRVSACLGTAFGFREAAVDYARFEEWRDKYKSAHVDTSNVKLYIDGIPSTESRTACFLEPYVDNQGQFESDHRGSLLCAPELLNRDVIELDRRGFTVKIHSCGDGAVRASLDAYEAARAANGDTGLRHEVAHSIFVAESDRSRFKQLNVVADVSPYAWYPSALSEDMSACCGHKRMEGCYPIKSLIHHGVQIVAGSDWPSASPSLNPWLGFGTMVTRRNPSGEPPFTLAEDQAVTVAEALEIFTIGGAAALDKADESGTLEVGKSADMAVLDRDIFGVDASEIAGTVVEMTVFEGRIVFDGKQ